MHADRLSALGGRRVRTRLLPLWMAILLSLTISTACSKQSDNPARQDAEIARAPSADPKAVEAVTRLVQGDLDAIPTTIQQLLSQVATAGQTTSDQFSISYGGETVAIDWWLWRRRLIEFKGLDQTGQPLLGLSKTGMALLAKPPSWFTAIGTPDPSSTCQSMASLTSVTCSLKIVYGIAMTPLGSSAAGNVAPLPMTVTDTATSDGKVWRADAIDYGTAGNPSAAVLIAMLGPPLDRDTARQQYLAELASKAEATRVSGVDTTTPNPQ